MRWTHDLSTGALYFKISDEPIAAQRVLGDGLIVDVSDAGGVVGIEVLDDAARQALLAQTFNLGLDGADFDLVIAVIGSQVSGDRERLGIPGRPPIESRDDYTQAHLDPQPA